MDHSGREWERMWREGDDVARREMDEILEKVDRKSKGGESGTTPNIQRGEKSGGTYDADGRWVCGVYL